MFESFVRKNFRRHVTQSTQMKSQCKGVISVVQSAIRGNK